MGLALLEPFAADALAGGGVKGIGRGKEVGVEAEREDEENDERCDVSRVGGLGVG